MELASPNSFIQSRIYYKMLGLHPYPLRGRTLELNRCFSGVIYGSGNKGVCDDSGWHCGKADHTLAVVTIPSKLHIERGHSEGTLYFLFIYSQPFHVESNQAPTQREKR